MQHKFSPELLRAEIGQLRLFRAANESLERNHLNGAKVNKPLREPVLCREIHDVVEAVVPLDFGYLTLIQTRQVGKRRYVYKARCVIEIARACYEHDIARNDRYRRYLGRRNQERHTDVQVALGVRVGPSSCEVLLLGTPLSTLMRRHAPLRLYGRSGSLGSS